MATKAKTATAKTAKTAAEKKLPKGSVDVSNDLLMDMDDDPDEDEIVFERQPDGRLKCTKG